MKTGAAAERVARRRMHFEAVEQARKLGEWAPVQSEHAPTPDETLDYYEACDSVGSLARLVAQYQRRGGRSWS